MNEEVLEEYIERFKSWYKFNKETDPIWLVLLIITIAYYVVYVILSFSHIIGNGSDLIIWLSVPVGILALTVIIHSLKRRYLKRPIIMAAIAFLTIGMGLGFDVSRSNADMFFIWIIIGVALRFLPEKF